jgi:di/tricarboxylate transporter
MNLGILAIVSAWLIAGMKVDPVVSGFPTSLFITLVGVTLLFTQAHVNGTLDRVALRAVRLCRGNVGMMPIAFFFVALGLATMGPGNIASIALIAPLAMSTAHKAKIPPFLMAIMAANGSNAGALSPLAPTGVIATGLMNKIGLSGHEWQTFWFNAGAHALVAFGGYFLFGGWKLFKLRYDEHHTESQTFTRNHWTTIAVIAALVVAVVGFKVNVGMAAMTGAVVLALLRTSDQSSSMKQMPWNVIVLVTGVTVLVSILEKTHAMKYFSDSLASLANPNSATFVVAFVVGLISVYASTSGVILPTFLPMVPGLVAHIGAGVSAFALASSINVGGHLVDISPLSTTGALCIASALVPTDSKKLFNQMLAWGLSMSVVGAAICWLFFRSI